MKISFPLTMNNTIKADLETTTSLTVTGRANCTDELEFEKLLKALETNKNITSITLKSLNIPPKMINTLIHRSPLKEFSMYDYPYNGGIQTIQGAAIDTILIALLTKNQLSTLWLSGICVSDESRWLLKGILKCIRDLTLFRIPGLYKNQDEEFLTLAKNSPQLIFVIGDEVLQGDIREHESSEIETPYSNADIRPGAIPSTFIEDAHGTSNNTQPHSRQTVQSK